MPIFESDEHCDHEPDPAFMDSLSPSDVALFYSFLMMESALRESGGGATLPKTMRVALANFGRVAGVMFMSRCDCVGCTETALRRKFPEFTSEICRLLGVEVVHVDDGETEASAVARAKAELAEAVFSRADKRADKSRDAAAVTEAMLKSITRH